MSSDPALQTHHASASRLARKVLAAFVFTFIASRILVILIMTRRIPDLFLHAGETHVHHLNYGIFLLSGVGGWLLFCRLQGLKLQWAAVLYGIGLALTFDEFGMWLHLGGSYWQRGSYDAVVVVASVLALIAFSPAISKFRTVHWTVSALILAALLTFAYFVLQAGHYAGTHAGPYLQEIERSGPQ